MANRPSWSNRDLNVGAIVSLAPNLTPFTDLLGVDTDTVKKVLATWGPGRFDAELDKDGKALRPDGKQAGTLMHGAGTFFDARLNDKDQYPVAAKSGAGNTRSTPDKLTCRKNQHAGWQEASK